ncbi:DUF5670 family protein [Actinacidiphila oryziradicis]|uniref:Hydrophobic protein n=1 Tax=Actinacidiphila oryziradicis TaxID=2571141 RepID=A0A4U0RW40_9ACTN|nr:DUF5670 family protein [Actinacidiphila oryziradicis]TJZ99802.1 hydrophobic protein [Actinacidiphila oryziradicis]
MILWILLLLLVLVLFGVGFSVHLLWIAAVVLLILWLLGFMRHGRSNSGRRSGARRSGRRRR